MKPAARMAVVAPDVRFVLRVLAVISLILRTVLPARSGRAVLLCLGLLGPASLSAQAAGTVAVPQAISGQEVEAQPAGAPIHVDGRLDDSAWAHAEWFTGFTQRDPREGEPATLATRFAILYDKEAVYIGARMENPEILAQVTRRDNPANSERIIFSFDTYRDRRTAYSFGVTATGVRVDYYHPGDSEHGRDYSFDPVWQAKAAEDSAGWTAEIRIPFSQLRFNAGETQTWGININRYIPSRNEDDYWVLIPKNETGWASRFAQLDGIRGIRSSRRIELLPYTAANSTITGDRNPRDPFDNGVNLEARAGLDLKMGLGPSLTLDGTVNPDFGQVEADPAVVNLSAVETFFDERRPFFTEGANLLRGGGANWFYSRRIGAPPRGSADGDFVDQPKAATILGAAKLTGRLPSGLSVGALAAVTDQAFARTYDTTGSVFSDTKVAPVAGYGVVRLQQEVGASASTVGLTMTAVERSLERDSPLAGLFSRQAFGGGLDWNLRFNGGDYILQGALGFSYIRGDTGAIARVQRSSAHYFQRPDQDYATYDPTRESLLGWVGSLNFSKNAGRHWLYEFGGSAESPAFEINDAGRLGGADDIDTYASLRYRENTPGPLFREYNVRLGGSSGWNFGGTRQYSEIGMDANATFHNFVQASLGFEVRAAALSDGLTRGGPLMRRAPSAGVDAEISSPFSASTRWELDAAYEWDGLGSWAYDLGAQLSVRPSSRWELSIRPSLEREVERRQYVSQEANGPASTYGTRYVFGTIGRTTIAARIRMNYALSPDLSLEAYAEPFAASGQYYHLGELTAAGTDRLRRYGTGGSTISQDASGTLTVTDGPDTFQIDPNFNIVSFRSNVVLRWEWRAGSTFFFVWQQDRSGREDPFRRAGVGGLGRSLSTSGDNFLAVKVSYWLPVS
ncbi:MAG: DUF5916 domain-containing protein [Gemmatimonadales bacterium]